MVGQRTFTLLSVNREGAERIASLEQKSDTRLTRATETPGPNSAAMKLDFRMVGGGTMTWNLDRGYVRSSETALTMDGTMAGPVEVTFHGTIRAVTESSPIR
jgi:hypothetical protein